MSAALPRTCSHARCERAGVSFFEAAASCAPLVALLKDAAAAPHRFEPSDLELEEPGNLDFDAQLGLTTGAAGAGRALLPDYEVDLGITSRFEVGLDGAFTMESAPSPGARFGVGEPLWLSAKLGLVDVHAAGDANVAALGLQLGPRLPVGSELNGAGYEVLLLAGFASGPKHLAFNLGGLVDPASGDTRRRPYGALGSVSASLDLDDESHWSLSGGVAVGYYVAEYAKQVSTVVGVTRSGIAGAGEVSLQVVATPVGDADRIGVLVGVSPRVKCF